MFFFSWKHIHKNFRQDSIQLMMYVIEWNGSRFNSVTFQNVSSIFF